MKYYDGQRISSALIHLFPEVNFDKNKFTVHSILYSSLLFIIHSHVLLINKIEQYWAEAKNRRQFFEDFAAKKGFDPLSASHWYHIPSFHVYHSKVLLLNFTIIRRK